MKKVKIGIVSYGAREVAMADAFLRSEKYDVELYIADKNKNPFNLSVAKRHEVFSDQSDVKSITDWFRQYKPDFVIPGSETPIIAGLADECMKYHIPAICPTKEYAIEASKVRQRLLTEKVAPEINPRFKVWESDKSKPIETVKDEVYKWLEELNYQVAVKPDKPGYGKGVGVWGDHFNSEEEVWEHFRNLYEGGAVIIEEKIEGEEFSLQCFSDGTNLIALPAVRDYKRRFEGDRGPNTGSMGSYDNASYILPFMTKDDYKKAVDVTWRKFVHLRGMNHNPNLRGMPFYVAFICTKDGIKHFEDNSRPGDGEIIGLLAKMKNDFVDVCFDIIHGNLKSINFEKLATVGTYLVPNSYPEKDEEKRVVDLSGAYELSYLLRELNDGVSLILYPASMNENVAGKSRTVYSLGIAPKLHLAGEISLAGVKSIHGNDLDSRSDIASADHIVRSIKHMEELRG